MRSCSNIAGIYIYICMISWCNISEKNALSQSPALKKNKYCRSKTKPGFRLGIWGLDDVWWELALRIPHSWLENWRLGVGPNPLSQPRPFCSFLGCVMPEFFFGVLTTTKCEKLMATLVGWSSAGVWWIEFQQLDFGRIYVASGCHGAGWIKLGIAWGWDTLW